MNKKKSFILYADLLKIVEQLPDEQAGKLLKIVLKFVNEEEVCIEDLLLKIAFEPIKQQLIRDAEKWDSIKGKRSLAGKRSAEIKKENQQSTTKSTLVECVEIDQTKSTVSVNDTVNVTVSVNDTVNVINNSHEQFLEKLLLDEFLGEKEAIEISCRVLIDRPLLENFNANLKISNKNHIHWSEYLKHLRNWINTRPPEKTITKIGSSSKFEQAIESHKGAEKLLGI